MSSIEDFVRFLIDFPQLFYENTYTPFIGMIIFGILAGLLLAGSLFKLKDLDISLPNIDYGMNSIELFLMSFIFIMLSYGELRRHYKKKGFEEPIASSVHDFAKPTDIINSLREDDKNSLIFGRSKFPTDVMDGEQEGKEVLRGHENSSGLGEQYGTFTGMTLYGGPPMYHEDTLNKVFEYDKFIKGERDSSMDEKRVLLRNKYDQASSEEERENIKQEMIKLAMSVSESQVA